MAGKDAKLASLQVSPREDSWYSMTLRTHPLLLSAVGFVMVAVASAKPSKDWLASTASHLTPVLAVLLDPQLIHEIGIAIAVVGFVSWSIERAHLAEFGNQLSMVAKTKLDEIELASREAIVRGPLPRIYYEHVSTIMLNNRFVKYDWVVNLRFEWVSGKDQGEACLRCITDSEYKIKNYCGWEEEYEIDHFESCELEERFPGTAAIRYVRAKWEGSGNWIIEYQGKDSGEHVDKFVRFKQKVTMAAEAVLEVRQGSAKMVRPSQEDWVLISEPTMSVECNVDCPEDLIMEVDWPESDLSAGHKANMHEEPMPDGRKRITWDFPFPMSPYSCFFICWRRKEGRAIKPTDLPGGASEGIPT